MARLFHAIGKYVELQHDSQVLFRYVYQLTFPSLYLDFLAAFSFINLNIFELLQMQCIFGSINFDSRMYVLGSLVLVMELAVAGIAFAKSKEGKAAEVGGTRAMLCRVPPHPPPRRRRAHAGGPPAA